MLVVLTITAVKYDTQKNNVYFFSTAIIVVFIQHEVSNARAYGCCSTDAIFVFCPIPFLQSQLSKC